MLYDTRWDKTKTDLFTLKSLIAWLETMPVHKEYEYMNCTGGCLFGQYVVANGVSWKRVEGNEIYALGETAAAFKRFFYDKIARQHPRTFGAALERAKAAL